MQRNLLLILVVTIHSRVKTNRTLLLLLPHSCKCLFCFILANVTDQKREEEKKEKRKEKKKKERKRQEKKEKSKERKKNLFFIKKSVLHILARASIANSMPRATNAQAINRAARFFLFLTTTALKPRCSHRTGCWRTSLPVFTLVSGLRSEYSNPSRSTLAGSGLNRLSVAPDIQSAPGKASFPPSGPRRNASASRGGSRALGNGAGIGRACAPPSDCDSLAGQGDPCVRRPSVHFAARASGASRPLRNSIQTTLVLSCPLAIFSPPVLFASSFIGCLGCAIGLIQCTGMYLSFCSSTLLMYAMSPLDRDIDRRGSLPRPEGR